MARLNVGTPRFFIDYLSYYRAKGAFKHTYANPTNYTFNSMQGVLEGDSAGFSNEVVIGMNPSSFFDEEIAYNIGYNSHNFGFNSRVPLYFPNKSTDKFWIGAFGHNFKTENFKSLFLHLYSDNQRLYSTFPEHVDGAGDVNTVTEICNMPSVHDSESFQYNGWSLGILDNAIQESIGVKTIIFGIETELDIQDSIRIILGSLGFGTVYEMPASANLDLTIGREYDGISTQKTLGGHTLTEIKYHKAADWAGGVAWELYDGNYNNATDGELKDPRASARGRRYWDLSFSHVSDTDLFALNEMVYGINPTDSDTNTLSGYDSSANFFNNGNFNSAISYDSSFVSSILNLTIGGALPFLFQPDKNNNSPDQWAMCTLDMDSFEFKQVANNVYDINMRIREVW
tara:strand:- start:6590 stop:7789 length:1200 start_codon:yes stop_codon:yes gene_type:complete